MTQLIEVTQPFTTPAIPERTYDAWIVSYSVINGSEFPLINAQMTCRKMCSADGHVDMQSDVTLQFIDLFGLSAVDPDISAWIALTNKIVKAKMDQEGIR